MKIDNIQVNKISEMYNKNKKDVKKKLAESPDVRSEKVDKLKDAVQNGSYNVDSEKIAEKILNRLG